MKLYALVFLLCAVCVGVVEASEIKRKKLWAKVFNKDVYKTTDLRPAKRRYQQSENLNEVFDLSYNELEKLDTKTQASFIKMYSKKIWRKLKQSKRREGKKKSCKTSSDCNPNECCVLQRRGNNNYCKKRYDLHQSCNPFLLPGISHECPCLTGLTCAQYNQDRKGHKQFMCVRVPKLPEELEPIFSKL